MNAISEANKIINSSYEAIAEKYSIRSRGGPVNSDDEMKNFILAMMLRMMEIEGVPPEEAERQIVEELQDW